MRKEELTAKLVTNDGTKEMVTKCIEYVKNSSGVVIFGAGVGGVVLYDLLAEHNLVEKIVCWSDNNSLKFGKSYKRDDLIIVEPHRLMELYGDKISVIIASSAYNIIRDQLMGYGYPKERIALYNFAFMDIHYTDRDFIYDHIEDFARAFEKMADEKSKRIFLNILNYKISKNMIYLENMSDDVDDERYQYFPDDIYSFLPDECFLDVGAYTGDTFQAFDSTYEHWTHYYGLEADPYVFNELKKTVAYVPDDKKSLYRMAAWNEKTKLYFEENAGSTKMEVGQEGKSGAVDADCIDSLLTGKTITLVKMDIEGAEYNALLGMKELIKANQPVLAICVYHKRDDFYRLTDFIEKLLPREYHYYLRQYRFTPTETVCYMVPRKRDLKTNFCESKF